MKASVGTLHLRNSSKKKISLLTKHFKKSSQRSLKECGISVTSTLDSLAYLSYLITIPLQTNPEIWLAEEVVSKESLPLLGTVGRMYEVTRLAEDAIFLALDARYISALSSLRSMLECVVNSSVYYCLLFPKFRDSASLLRKPLRNYNQSLVTIVEKLLVELPYVSDIASIEDIVTEKILALDGVRLPSFHSMLKQLFKWEILTYIFGSDTDAKFKSLYTDWYASLSKYTHSVAGSMYSDLHYQLDPLAKQPFEYLFSHFQCESFMKKAIHAIDQVGMIYFATIRKHITNPETFRHALKFMEKYKKEGNQLTWTNKAIQTTVTSS